RIHSAEPRCAEVVGTTKFVVIFDASSVAETEPSKSVFEGILFDRSSTLAIAGSRFCAWDARKNPNIATLHAIVNCPFIGVVVLDFLLTKNCTNLRRTRCQPSHIVATYKIECLLLIK